MSYPISNKQIGFISCRIKSLRTFDPAVKAAFPDSYNNALGVNSWTLDLEAKLARLTRQEASRIIAGLLDDQSYRDGVKELQKLIR